MICLHKRYASVATHRRLTIAAALVAVLRAAVAADAQEREPSSTDTAQLTVEGLAAAALTAAALPAPVQNKSNPEPSTYDKIWANFTEWYRNDDNRVVQQVLFTGRFQHEF